MAEALRSIVGVGASAGGLEALDRLLRSHPLDDGITLVIVTHRSESQDSVLEQILSRVTAMPIAEAADGAAIEANRAYVMPPRSALTVKDGRFVLRKPEDRKRQHNPVDIFLDSLGSEFGERAVGVVLSGGGSDGALGIKTIKAHGGLTIAQGSDGSAPRQHGMPDAAIATGAVDLVVPVEDMPGRINEYVRTLDSISTTEAPEKEAFDRARARICTALRNQVGHEFSGYKERTFMRRVHRRMQVLHLSNADSYADRLASDPDEVVRLFPIC